MKPLTLTAALATLETANYIFAGPGSPTYAVRCWRDSPIVEALARRLAEGAQLVFASAASIALGTSALPVYEIFKAGSDLYWEPGIDLLAPYGLKLVIVPHWNNAEGGVFDTSCCFMGRARFEQLERMLESDSVVLGIDEHTACTIDLANGRCSVTGAGQVTIRRRGRSAVHPSATTFPVDELRQPASSHNGASPMPPPLASTDDRRNRLARQLAVADRALAGGGEELTRAANGVFALASAIEGAIDAGVDGETTAAARSTLATLVTRWSRELSRKESGDAVADVRPFVDLLISVRASLRAAGSWETADAIRDGLAGLGIVLEDAPGETAWKTK